MSPFIQQITAWSYSRLMTYQKCPQLAKFTTIMKMREPENDAMKRGSAVHQAAQDFTEGKTKTAPVELANFKDDFKVLRESNAKCEQEWSFTKDWKSTGWFSNDAWLRIKVDAHCDDDDPNVMYIIDHKTGRVNDDHEKQRSLYGLGGLLKFPNVDTIIAQHWYLDHGIKKENTYQRRELETLRKYWMEESRAMLNDKRFPPNPGQHCRWCHFRKANNGPCQF